MFLWLSQNGCEGCEAIAERLERVLNLRMVTEGIKLHEIMEDCLRIARGDALDGSLRARRRCRIDHWYMSFIVFDNIFVFVILFWLQLLLNLFFALIFVVHLSFKDV